MGCEAERISFLRNAAEHARLEADAISATTSYLSCRKQGGDCSWEAKQMHDAQAAALQSGMNLAAAKLEYLHCVKTQWEGPHPKVKKKKPFKKKPDSN
jgi:hypothetical protein